jgi:hypothetical protein
LASPGDIQTILYIGPKAISFTIFPILESSPSLDFLKSGLLVDLDDHTASYPMGNFGFLFGGVNQPESEADHFNKSSTEGKKGGAIFRLPHTSCLIN